MLVDKKCEICGKEFKVPHWRIDSAKYCSKECQHNSLKAKPNLVCQICGKYFHRKPFHINRYKGDLGFCINIDGVVCLEINKINRDGLMSSKQLFYNTKSDTVVKLSNEKNIKDKEE